MKIEPNILTILDSGRTEDNLYFLPVGQLERKVYLDVNKVLEALGGKWNKKAKAHVFEQSIEEAINSVILTGEVTDRKKELQFFETPDKVADQVVDLAEIVPGHEIYEPNAGSGKILKAIDRKLKTSPVFWCEIDEILATKSNDLKIGQRIGSDAFNIRANGDVNRIWNFDRICMNPPFSFNGTGSQTDIDHVRHCIRLLKDRGILVSIMSPAIKFRTNRKTNDFRELLSNYRHEIIDLPESAFKESGTTIKTVILKVWKGSKS